MEGGVTWGKIDEIFRSRADFWDGCNPAYYSQMDWEFSGVRVHGIERVE